MRWLKRRRANIAEWVQIGAGLAQIFAVVIAGYWTFHLHEITGEAELNPNLTIDATELPYNDSQRLLVVHVRPKNVGKVPFDPDDANMWVRVKRIPSGLNAGAFSVDRLPVTYEQKQMLTRYHGGYEIDPGIEFDEVATFVVPPGTYHVEGELTWSDEDVGDQTLIAIK
jgi:hypothetical protein